MLKIIKMIKITSTFGGLLLLTACSNPAMNITSKPVSVNKTSAYVQSGITEMQPLEIRTFKKVEDSLKEVSNANCEVKGQGYSAKVITPSIVNVPVYGKKSQSITAYCASEGLAGTKSARITNIDLEQRQNSTASSGYSGGLIGSLIATAVSANMKERKGDRFAYKPISVKITTK